MMGTLLTVMRLRVLLLEAPSLQMAHHTWEDRRLIKCERECEFC